MDGHISDKKNRRYKLHSGCLLPVENIPKIGELVSVLWSGG